MSDPPSHGADALLPPPIASQVALFDARLAREPEDFVVDERLGFVPEGRGEHLWLRLEKRLLNTADVVALLARVYRVAPREIGVAGLKDRRAVARQWFSVPTAGSLDPLERALSEDGLAASLGAGARAASDLEGAALRPLAAARHRRKLRRGAHRANRFAVVLRELVPRSGALGPDATRPAAARAPIARLDAELASRLERVARDGFPNYFGAQRYGRGGSNLARARRWFARGGGARPRRRSSARGEPSPAQRGLWLSAARAALFDRVLGARVRDGSWCRLLDGEPLMLAGTRGFFLPESAEDTLLEARLGRHDIAPSGPLWGCGETPARGACLALERELLAAEPALRAGLERAGLEQRRRALRARPRALRRRGGAEGALALEFELEPGVFATSLLAELGRCRRGDEPSP